MSIGSGDGLARHGKPEPEVEHRLPRDTVLIAVFGGLWGLVELTLGVPLKSLRIPLSGAALAVLATLVCLTGRYFVRRRRGAILMMGCVAALVKVFSAGFVILGPCIAILMEAALAEAVIAILGRRRSAYVLAGMALVVYTVLHPFLMQGVLFGAGIYGLYVEVVQRAGDFLHAGRVYLGILILAYVGLHAAAGAAAGWTAWVLATRVAGELRDGASQTGRIRGMHG